MAITFEQFMRGTEELRQAQPDSEQKSEKESAKIRQAQLKGEQEMTEIRQGLTETREIVEKIGAEFGNDTNNDAQSVEEFFYRSLKKVMRLDRLIFDDIGRDVGLSDNSPEFNVILYNGHRVCVTEVKKKAHPEQTRELASRKIRQFRECFPQYADRQVYFALASLITDEDLIRSAEEAGVFLLAQGGEDIIHFNSATRAL